MSRTIGYIKLEGRLSLPVFSLVFLLEFASFRSIVSNNSKHALCYKQYHIFKCFYSPYHIIFACLLY